MKSKVKYPVFCLFPFCLIFILAACSSGPARDPTPLPEGLFPIDSRFEMLEKRLGKLIEPAISPVFLRDGKYYQYTRSVLLVFDPNAPSVQKVKLASLGREWDIVEAPEPRPEQTDAIYLNGHVVWDEVAPLFQMYGAGIIGLPLTGVHYNAEMSRYEQYYENMGFYRLEGDEFGQVRLLPFGMWFCGEKCGYIEPLESAYPKRYIVSSQPQDVKIQADEAFIEVAKRLDLNFTGKPLTETYLASDDTFEKIFENIVLISDPKDPARVSVRPLPQLVGIQPSPPVPASNAPGMFFFQIQGELGYNIPGQFMEYITSHGTMEVFGSPITELQAMESGISRQCYTNVCLEFHVNAPETLRVRPSALGIQYKNFKEQPVLEPEASKPTRDILSLQVWESHPLLSPDQPQNIAVAVFENTTPLVNVDFFLTIRLPDGVESTFYMPPTGENGQTAYQLSPINAPIGSVITYHVCMLGVTEQTICVIDSFLIWDTP